MAGPRRIVAIAAIRVALLAVLLGGWEALGRASGGFFLPPFTVTVSHLLALSADGTLGAALLASNLALVIGFPIAAALAIPIGFALGRRRLLDRSFSYWLDLLLVIPMIAVIPAIIVALGLGLSARVAVVVLFALPLLGLNARAAVRVIDQRLAEMARSFGAPQARVWTAVIIPAALPTLFVGLRQGLGRAISGMIVVELTLVPAGIGGLIVTYRSRFAAADLYAATLVILLEAILLMSLAQLVERRVQRRLAGA
ncbi:MAG TPA: ABC transporter permease subunit [Candidatus Limnocylindria bacterium]|nr:ABC transporter permease subunit [Candidatus Limnocylindria bacterium]